MMKPSNTTVIVSLIIAALAVTALYYAALGFAWIARDDARTSKRNHYAPPCGYGTEPILVREVDGEARVVCGCPR